jgi:flagellar export protein FliJ
MAFRFTLETVLRYRENLESREEAALQTIVQQIATVAATIDQVTAQIAAANRTRGELLAQPVNALNLQAILNEITAAGKQRAELLHTLEALEQKRDEQLKVYHAAHRNRQMLSDMLDDQQGVWEQERTRSEQKTLDDLFAARTQRA